MFYRDLLGLTKVDPIHKKLHVVFNATNLKQCSGKIPVGDDEITLAWEKKGKRLYYTLDVPEDFDVEIDNKTDLKLVAR